MTKRKTVSFNVIDTFCQLSESLADSGIRYLQGCADAPALATGKMDFKGKDHPSDDPVVKNLLLLADYLHITPQACLVFVAIYSLELTSREGIDWCDICGYFGINAIKSLSLRQYLSELTKKEIICCENPHGMLMYRSYCVHKDVESAMDSNIPYKKTKDKVEKLDRYQFCSKVGSLLHRNFDFEYDCGLEREELFEKVDKMEQQHAHLPFVKQLKSLKLDNATRICFYDMCDDFINNNDWKTNIYKSLQSIYQNISESMSAIRLFLDKTHPLQKNDLVELCPFDYAQNAEATLTDKGKRLFLEDDYDLFTMGRRNDKNLIRPESIQEKRLFFKEKTTQQLGLLKSSLMDKQLTALQQRLANNSLPQGVTVLFYGEPGTGKTEAAMQLAKASGRSVFHVDISACKSMWFGESEKIVKQLFDTYREKVDIVVRSEMYRGCAISTSVSQAGDIRLAAAQAADEMLSLKGVAASFVIFEDPQKINISARSYGRVNVQLMMEKIGGGGHQTMAATQLYDTTLEEARQKLTAAIDAVLDEAEEESTS